MSLRTFISIFTLPDLPPIEAYVICAAPCKQLKQAPKQTAPSNAKTVDINVDGNTHTWEVFSGVGSDGNTEFASAVTLRELKNKGAKHEGLTDVEYTKLQDKKLNNLDFAVQIKRMKMDGVTIKDMAKRTGYSEDQVKKYSACVLSPELLF